MSVILSPDAQADVIAAAKWYDGQPSRYGDAFNDEALAAVRKIGENPRMYSPVDDGIPGFEIREFLIARFDQRIIFHLEGDDVLVVAVIHASRRPGSWHRRLSRGT